MSIAVRPIRRTAARAPRVISRRPPARRDVAAQLFDPQKLAILLAAALDRGSLRGHAIGDVRVERCWPAGHAGLRFEWSFATGGPRRQTVYGAYGDAIDKKDHRAADRGRTTSAGLRDVLVFVPEFGVRLHTPDRDRKLPQLASLLERDAKLTTRRPRAVHLLGYKPARRAALRFDFDDGNGATARLMGKTFRDDRGARLVEVHREVQRHLNESLDGRCRVPDALEFIPHARLALFAWAAGRGASRGRALADARLLAAMDVLASLHAARIPGLPVFARDEELCIARRWLATLAHVEPRAADRGRTLVDALERLARRLDRRPPATIHRDFYEKQLVWSGRTTTLLDLDTLATGEPELDLGNYMGHLYLHRSQTAQDGAPRIDKLRELFAALADRYETGARALDRRVVDFYCASSLIRAGALHALRTATRPFAAGMWRLAKAILDGEVRS